MKRFIFYLFLFLFVFPLTLTAQNKQSYFPLEGKLEREAEIRIEPKWDAKVVREATEGEKFKLYGIVVPAISPYFKIYEKSDTLYVGSWHFKKTDQLEYITRCAENASKSQALENCINKEKQADQKRERRIQKYMDTWKVTRGQAKNLVDGDYWMGMGTTLAEVALGDPDRRVSSQGGVDDDITMWVYEERGLWLYFKNGELWKVDRVN